ncbi:hypothetical protein [Arthrobacter sp. ISL-28]|uniref:hypothetical protein n=1 Tax=Arthrobacter sp. ISL-28 TaxID=2819108 RepID=UPI001BE8F1CC|nr:hypothetical protein [Arthrobacter sp. ISL-28]MBT2522212.1 hypothetical protein [Arthrobacter sp. ISL-28]
MLTLQRRQLVGHDILLARHGNHICSMRLDRSVGRVVALLDDGSVDSAPNLISPDLRLPDTVGSVMRDDWKFLATVSGCIAGLTAVMITAAVNLAGLAADPALAELMSTYPAY